SEIRPANSHRACAMESPSFPGEAIRQPRPPRLRHGQECGFSSDYQRWRGRVQERSDGISNGDSWFRRAPGEHGLSRSPEARAETASRNPHYANSRAFWLFNKTTKTRMV